jgi:hypothetical protein
MLFPIVNSNVQYVKFTNNGGYESEQKAAEQVFEFGRVYKAIREEIFSYTSLYFFEGIEQGWNTCLFDNDVEVTMVPVYMGSELLVEKANDNRILKVVLNGVDITDKLWIIAINTKKENHD